MPDMDGFETASHIKRRERTRHVPIIFLTAADRDAHLALRGYAAGAVDYLTKPFDPWVLRAKVSVFVELWTKTQQLAAQSDLVRTREGELRAAGVAVDEATALLQGGARRGRRGRPLPGARRRRRCRSTAEAAVTARRSVVAWIISAPRRPVMSRTRIRNVAHVDQHQVALRHGRPAAEHDQRAEPLRVAERHAAHVEDDPRRGVAAEDLIDGARQALDRGHVDLAGERHHGLGRGAAHGDGKIRSIHPDSLTWIRPAVASGTSGPGVLGAPPGRLSEWAGCDSY